MHELTNSLYIQSRHVLAKIQIENYLDSDNHANNYNFFYYSPRASRKLAINLYEF